MNTPSGMDDPDRSRVSSEAPSAIMDQIDMNLPLMDNPPINEKDRLGAYKCTKVSYIIKNRIEESSPDYLYYLEILNSLI
jgi:hypothetical protein